MTDPVNDIAAIYQRLRSCDLCPIKCGIDRTGGGTGACGAQQIPKIYQNFMHLGEECCISPAFVINMAGCNLKCPACPERMRWKQAGLNVRSAVSYARSLVSFFRSHGMIGNPDRLCSLEWIGGEPSIHLPFVLEASKVIRDELSDDSPIILLNTNGYFDTGFISMMPGILDGFVFDLKCVPGCVRLVGGAEDYWETVTRNILTACEDPDFESCSIVRHLVMSGHVSCCTKPIIDWCREHVPAVTFNLMTTFRDVDGSGLVMSDRETATAYAKNAGIADLLVNGQMP